MTTKEQLHKEENIEIIQIKSVLNNGEYTDKYKTRF